MNGTSMSSPNACGCVSLIISACKQTNVPYSIYQLRRAIENTAQVIQNVEPWAQGQGLIQVKEAYDHLAKNHDDLDVQANYEVSIGGSRLGIYLREQHETTAPDNYMVDVNVEFMNRITPEKKIAYSADISLSCKESWVQAPKFLGLGGVYVTKKMIAT